MTKKQLEEKVVALEKRIERLERHPIKGSVALPKPPTIDSYPRPDQVVCTRVPSLSSY